MDQETFIQQYCEASRVAWEWLRLHYKAVPCDCGGDYCYGWKMVPIEEEV